MSDRTVRVRLEAITGSYEAAMAKAAATTRALGMSADGMGKRLQTFGSGMSRVGNRMSIGVTLPLLAVGKAAIDTTAQFSKTMNTMGAVAGVPGPQLEKLSALAKKLGAETVFSANEAAEGMLALSKAGISTADIMGGGLANALDLATAGDLDLANAAETASNAMNVFNLSGKRSKEAVDALAGAANVSSADVADLALALAQGGSAAAQAGFSIQETTGFLAAMADAGIKGSDAGTSLKTMLISLQAPTEKAAGLMEELGLNFLDAQGNLKPMPAIAEELQRGLEGMSRAQQAAALKTIFGTDAFRAATVAMKEGRGGMDRYIKATNEVGTAHKVAEGKMKGLPGVIEEMKGAWETFLLEAGPQLVPIFTSIAKDATEMLRGFSKLSPATKELFVKGALSAAALGPVARILGAMASSAGLLLRGVSAASRIGTVGKVAGAGAGAGAGGAAAVGGGVSAATLASLAAFAAAIGLVIKVTRDQQREVESASDKIIRFGSEHHRSAGAVANLRGEVRRSFTDYSLLALGVRALSDDQEELNRKHLAYIDRLTGSREATKAYEEATSRSVNTNRRQESRIAALIGGFHDLTGGIDDTTVSQVNNLLAVGDVNGAIRVLRDRLADATDKLGGHGKALDMTKEKVRENEARVKAYTERLNEIPGRKHTDVTANTTKATTTIRQWLDSLSDTQVEVMVHSRLVRGGTAHSGGWVPGSGDVPITAQSGEFIVNRRKAQENAAMLEALNSGRVYHDGGWVGHPQLNVNLARLAAVIEEARKGFLSGNLVQVGRQMETLGFRLSGHPQWPPIGAHVRGSYHYLGRAWDANYGPGGESAIEKAAIAEVVPMLAALPHAELLHPANDPKHRDHLHYAMGSGAYLPKPFAGFVSMAERNPEIVAPAPVMRQIVREESRPSGPTGPFRLTGTMRIVDSRGLVEIIDGRIEYGPGVGRNLDREVHRRI